MKTCIGHNSTTGPWGWRIWTRLLLLLALTTASAGCLSTKSYVDPKFRDATYQSVRTPEAPVAAVITYEFQFNGKHGNKNQDALVRRKSTRVLAATKVFSEVEASAGAAAGQLQIRINNLGDIGSAVGKGFATGLTFGLAGSEVVDGYEMTVIYTPAGGSPTTRFYKHAIHSTIGAHAPPPGMQPVPLADAFDQVVEEMLLNCLRDFQRDGVIK